MRTSTHELVHGSVSGHPEAGEALPPDHRAAGLDGVTSPGAFRPAVTHLAEPNSVGGYDQIQRWPNGNLCYLLRGELHRTSGPAFIGADGSMTWLRFGREHRTDGPAVCGPDGEVEYWIDGHQLDGSTALYATVLD